MTKATRKVYKTNFNFSHSDLLAATDSIKQPSHSYHRVVKCHTLCYSVYNRWDTSHITYTNTELVNNCRRCYLDFTRTVMTEYNLQFIKRLNSKQNQRVQEQIYTLYKLDCVLNQWTGKRGIVRIILHVCCTGACQKAGNLKNQQPPKYLLLI